MERKYITATAQQKPLKQFVNQNGQRREVGHRLSATRSRDRWTEMTPDNAISTQ